MKKIVFAITLCFLSIKAFAAGPFDGIYSVSLNGAVVTYIAIHENNNNMIAIALTAEPDDSWEALSGVRAENSVNLLSLLGTVKLDITANFNNDGNAVATVNSCTGDCSFPSGSALNLIKIF